MDLTVVFVIRHPEKPVFFVEMKPGATMLSKSARRGEDQQMRSRFAELMESVDLPVFYGVIAIATHLCIYEYNQETRRLLPRRIPDSGEGTDDIAPVNRWNIYVLTPEGEQQLRAVANHIKAMCPPDHCYPN